MTFVNKFIAMLAAATFTVGCTNPVALASTTTSGSNVEEPTTITLYTTDYLRVREEPSTDATIIDVFAPGTKVTATDCTNKYNGWVQIQYDDTHKYYMHSDWLTMCVPEIDETESPTDVLKEESNQESSVVDESNDDDSENTYDDCVEDESNVDDTNNNDYNTYTDGNYTYGISPGEFQDMGVIEYNGYYYTYYSELVMPGENLYIPGRWTDSDGFVRDENGYLCLASNTPETMDRFSYVDTPWGTGIIYDYGTGNDYVIDVYVGW